MYFEWKPYVSVAQRLTKARRFAAKVTKKEGREPTPVQARGRTLTKNFWGQAWCDNLDQYCDFANRLPRGRQYLGNGSVVDLQIKNGRIEAIVAGSEVYEVEITIQTLNAKTWKSLQRDCSQSIHSLLDLLQGRFDEGVMRRLAQRTGGLFPQPKEIRMECSCPDYANVCKHIAAVIYGVGVRLDNSPELLFTLRNVDHTELITQAVAAENLEQSLTSQSSSLAGTDLEEIFGIDLGESAPMVTATKTTRRPRRNTKGTTQTAAKSSKPDRAKHKARATSRRKTGRKAVAKGNATG